MNEGKPNALDNVLNDTFDPWHGYPRTKVDTWIDGAAICFWLCGGLSLLLAFSAPFPMFMGLMLGAWFIAWIFWLWRTFRRMLWKARRDEQRGGRVTSKVQHLLVGIGFILAGVIWASGFSSLHHEWSSLLAMGGTGLILGGCVEIAQVVKSKKET